MQSTGTSSTGQECCTAFGRLEGGRRTKQYNTAPRHPPQSSDSQLHEIRRDRRDNMCFAKLEPHVVSTNGSLQALYVHFEHGPLLICELPARVPQQRFIM